MYPYFENKKQKIFTSYNSKTYNWDSHFHNYLEFAYCFSGFQKVTVENTVYTLSQGDAIVIFPNMVHEYIKAETDIPTESISLISNTDFFISVIPELKTMRPVSPFIKAENISENSSYAFRKMTETTDITELLGWSFIALSGLMKNLKLIPAATNSDFKLAPDIISYININFQKPLTIKHLSREFGYHPSYIAHIFCDQLKIPFRTYLGAVRSEEAANMLSTTDKSITEIAYECGFGSLNTFCRCFKKHFLQTPSQYRKNK